MRILIWSRYDGGKVENCRWFPCGGTTQASGTASAMPVPVPHYSAASASSATYMQNSRAAVGVK